jgi:hypothetical protein
MCGEPQIFEMLVQSVSLEPDTLQIKLIHTIVKILSFVIIWRMFKPSTNFIIN